MRVSIALRVAIGAVVAAVLAVAALAAWGRHELSRPYAGFTGPHVDVVLEEGLDAGAMLEKLAGAGVVERPALARAWLSLRGGAAELHAGEYRFASPASALEVLARLRRGEVLLHEITLPEGLTMFEIARRLEAAGVGSAADLLAGFGDPAPIRDLDPDAVDLEGYLFPETYRFARGEAPARVAAAMLGEFRRAAGERYAERAARVGLTTHEAVTLASMIERETALASERARVAAVFHNRLRRRMRLECDPTVLYALERAGRPVARLALHHLRFESPWNTYFVAGLPAGPIGNPSRASLDAAVEPLATDELYFVAAPEGGHRFSRDLDGHLRAVADWRGYARSSR